MRALARFSASLSELSHYTARLLFHSEKLCSFHSKGFHAASFSRPALVPCAGRREAQRVPFTASSAPAYYLAAGCSRIEVFERDRIGSGPVQSSKEYSTQPKAVNASSQMEIAGYEPARLANLSPGNRKYKRRRARGGGDKHAGRGHKGQRSRSGERSTCATVQRT